MFYLKSKNNDIVICLDFNVDNLHPSSCCLTTALIIDYFKCLIASQVPSQYLEFLSSTGVILVFIFL